jgi:hypothetical protein
MVVTANKKYGGITNSDIPLEEFGKGGMLPDLAAMAFGGNLILEKYQDGGSNWEIVSDNEWEIIK